MSPPETKKLVLALVAAFPHPPVPGPTTDLYCDQLPALMPNAELAGRVVERWISSHPRFPAVADLVGEYRALARGLADERDRSLEEPSLSMAENARRSRAYLENRWPSEVAS